jgi:hypothetical protein
MGVKHDQKLGKTKSAKVSEGVIAHQLSRILDTKENPESLMDTLIEIDRGQK